MKTEYNKVIAVLLMWKWNGFLKQNKRWCLLFSHGVTISYTVSAVCDTLEVLPCIINAKGSF